MLLLDHSSATRDYLEAVPFSSLVPASEMYHLARRASADGVLESHDQIPTPALQRRASAPCVTRNAGGSKAQIAPGRLLERSLSTTLEGGKPKKKRGWWARLTKPKPRWLAPRRPKPTQDEQRPKDPFETMTTWNKEAPKAKEEVVKPTVLKRGVSDGMLGPRDLTTNQRVGPPAAPVPKRPVPQKSIAIPQPRKAQETPQSPIMGDSPPREAATVGSSPMALQDQTNIPQKRFKQVFQCLIPRDTDEVLDTTQKAGLRSKVMNAHCDDDSAGVPPPPPRARSTSLPITTATTAFQASRGNLPDPMEDVLLPIDFQEASVSDEESIDEEIASYLPEPSAPVAGSDRWCPSPSPSVESESSLTSAPKMPPRGGGDDEVHGLSPEEAAFHESITSFSSSTVLDEDDLVSAFSGMLKTWNEERKQGRSLGIALEGIPAPKGCLKQDQTSTAGVASYQRPPSVRFDRVIVREYERTVGDNPSCTSGPPIAIGWSYSPTTVFDLDRYEEIKSPLRRDRRDLFLSASERTSILKDHWQISSSELREARREATFIQYCREKTILSRRGRRSPTDEVKGRASSVPVPTKLRYRSSVEIVTPPACRRNSNEDYTQQPIAPPKLRKSASSSFISPKVYQTTPQAISAAPPTTLPQPPTESIEKVLYEC